jgi:hypothetical protein
MSNRKYREANVLTIHKELRNSLSCQTADMAIPSPCRRRNCVVPRHQSHLHPVTISIPTSTPPAPGTVHKISSYLSVIFEYSWPPPYSIGKHKTWGFLGQVSAPDPDPHVASGLASTPSCVSELSPAPSCSPAAVKGSPIPKPTSS